jgi:hypothetical protein
MLGGVKLNGEKIFTDALAETEKLEKELRETFENPPAFLVG